MTITVEDGTGTIAGANSYVSLADAKSFATSRGKTFAADDTALTAFLFSAMDYLAAKEDAFKGSRLLTTQPLSWPRKDVYLYDACNVYPAPGSLPNGLINAQVQLMMDQDAGIDLMPAVSGPFVVHEKVDVIETEYSEKLSTDGQPQLSRVEAFLKPLLNVGSGFALTSVRV